MELFPLFSLLISLLCLIPPLRSATIRVSDADPPEESYWTSFDSQQFYLDPTVKANEKERILTVSSGPVLGRLINTHRNRSAFAFLGIPYAEAPEYSLRFHSPQSKRPWGPRVYDGRQVKPACGADPILTYKKDEGGPVSEDCLQVYVYASERCIEEGGCSVMAVVHGGKFNFESPAVFPEDVIVDNFAASPRDIVTVLIGFRLGSFGWINLGPNGEGNSAPKNLGLHDIVAGLEWIEREIHLFGGDKARVTLFGHSSGACLVDTLSLSPRVRGLFSQLIIASAASLLSASEINQNVNVAASWAVAKAAGCVPSHYDPHSDESRHTSMESSLRCLRSIPYQRIIDAQRSLYNSSEDFYGPAIDGDILPSSNWDLTPSRPLYPTLIGTVNAESRIGRYMLTPDGKGVNSTLIDEYCRHVGYGIWFERKEEVYRECFNQYSKDRNALYISEDLGLFMPVIKSANALSREGNKVYYYHYTYTGSPAAFDNRWGLETEDRPAHSEEYIYILGLHRANFSAKDYAIQEVFSKVFADFVNRGDPTPEGREWPLYEQRQRNYFQIDFPSESISAASFPGPSTHFMSRANDFWIDFIEKKIAGNHTVIQQFPEGFDGFQLENLSQLLKSHYANSSSHHDKTDYAVRVGYERWREWMEQRRNDYLSAVRSLPLQSASPPDSQISLTQPLPLLQNLPSSLPNNETHPFYVIIKCLVRLATVVLALFGLYSLLSHVIPRRERHEYSPINAVPVKTHYGVIN